MIGHLDPKQSKEQLYVKHSFCVIIYEISSILKDDTYIQLVKYKCGLFTVSVMYLMSCYFFKITRFKKIVW
jgi:hypothetical protein